MTDRSATPMNRRWTAALLGVLALLLTLFSAPASAQTAPVAAGEQFITDLAPPMAILVDLLANDSSPRGEPIEAEIEIQPEVGQLVEQWDGSWVYSLPAGAALGGLDRVTVTYHVRDEDGDTSAAVTACIGACDEDVKISGAQNDYVETVMDQPVTIAVLANDAPGLSLSTISVAPRLGTATKAGDMVTYTPNSGVVGTDAFQYRAVDATGAVSSAYVTVSVLPAGQPPVAVDDQREIAAGACVSIHVTANDYDPDGDDVYLPAFPVVVPPQNGTAAAWGEKGASYSPTLIEYCPDTGFLGTDTFTYRVHDGYGSELSDEATVTVTVIEGDGPVALPDDVIVRDTEDITIDVTANDYSILGSSLSLSGSWLVTPPTHGSVTKVSSTSVRYTPDPVTGGWYDPADDDSFSYEIVDANGTKAVGTVRVKIRNMEAYPSFFIPVWTALDSVPVDVSSGSTSFTVLDNDMADGPAWVGSFDASGLEGTLTLSGNTFSYAPAGTESGVATFTYEAENNATTSTGTVELHFYRPPSLFIAAPGEVPGDETIPLLPPVARADSFLVIPDTVTHLDVLANDSDENGDSLSISAFPQPPAFGTVSVTATELVLYTPDTGFWGNDSFTYQVSDGQGGTSSTVVTITVPDPSSPPAAGDDTASVAEDSSIAIPVLANDMDWDGDALRPSAVTVAPDHGTATILGDGTIRYTPEADWYGTDVFQYKVTDDDEGESVEAGLVVVTVSPVNDPPTLVADQVTTLEDTPVTIQVLSNDSDVEGSYLRVYSVTSASNGTARKSYNGSSVIYEPDLDFFGTDTFTYKVDDGELAAGQSGFGPVTVTVRVEKDNHPPVVKTDQFTINEDLSTGLFGWQFLSNDGDPDGDSLSIIDITQPANATLLANSELTSFSFKSDPNWCGYTSSDYTVSDGYGGTAVGLIKFHVQCRNDYPVPGDDSVSTTENVDLDIPWADLLANDTDVENHALSIASVGSASHGTVTLQSGEIVRYEPSSGYNGSDAFTYVVEDSRGAQATGNVAVTVAPDDPPVPRFTYTCSGRVCDFDATSTTDDQPLYGYSFKWDFPETYYSVDASGPTVHWTFDTGGTKRVKLEVRDSAGQKRYKTEYLEIVEPPPVAVDDLLRFYRGYNRAIYFSSLTANDSDPDGDTLTVIEMGTPSRGTLDCQPGDDYCFFSPPWSTWRGLSTVEYTLSDGHGETDTATLTIEYY